MRAAAANLEFERAAQIRDRLKRLRSPGGPLPVRLEAPAWSTRIVVGSDAATMVSVPARTGERVVSLAITAEAAFVPAEHGGPPGDRRTLGCWVEVGH